MAARTEPRHQSKAEPTGNVVPMKSAAAEAALAAPAPTPRKDLYEIGEIPPLGHVPAKMYAWVIRKERHGPPDQAMQVEVVPTWELDSHDVLVLVMAAGVNYNGVWAALGKPVSTIDVHKHPYHVAGSDAAGIVYAVGSKVKRWKVGDEVVVHCNQDDGDDEECNGGDPMFSPSPAHLGLRDARRLVRPVRPRAGPPAAGAAEALNLGGERLLHAGARHRLPHAVRASPACHQAGPQRSGLGLLGGPGLDGGATHRHHRRQCHRRRLRGRQARLRHAAGRARRHQPQEVRAAGANCLTSARPEYDTWFKEVRKFGAAIWEITGKGNNVDFVFEHPGAATFPVSVFVVKRGGMVVICAGTTGYNLTMDARYLWMHQKRVQGSHFANLLQAAQANKLVIERRIDPAMSEVFPWSQIPKAHTRMWRNEHRPGNMAVLVSAPTTGLRTFEDAIEESRRRFG